MATFEYKIVNNAGGVYDTIVPTTVSDATHDLDGSGTFSFTMHGLDPKCAAVVPVERELQIWRNGSFHDWYAITGTDASWEPGSDVFRATCRRLPWYWTRRLFGKADRTDYGYNSDFEFGGGWNVTASTTFTVDGVRKKTGVQSAKLVNATAGTDRYIWQDISVTGTGVGTLVTLVAWFFIETSGWVGPAFEDRGLFVQRVGTDDYDWYPIDDDTPRGVWQRAEVTTWIPPNVTETIQRRFYSPGGTIRWDASSVTYMESVSYYDTDLATIAAAYVTHSQDPTFAKTSLNIGTSTPATGLVRTKHHQHAEHERIGDALQQLRSELDWYVALTDTTRTFTTAYPRMGTARSAFALSEFTALSLSNDGDAAVTSLVVTGDGEGPDREEGAAIIGGTVALEAVEAAPPNTDIDTLDARAAERVRVLSNPRILRATLAPNTRIGTWLPGDTATIALSHGAIVTSGSWRCISIRHDHATDRLHFEANPA